MKVKQLLQSFEPSNNETATSTGSEDEVPSSYMVPSFEQVGLNKGKIPYAIPNMLRNHQPKMLVNSMSKGDNNNNDIRMPSLSRESTISSETSASRVEDEVNGLVLTKTNKEEELLHLKQFDEYRVKPEQRIKFDRERFSYVFAKSLRPVYLMDKDLICHLPSLTFYTLSLPHYMYYEVENPHENPDVPIFSMFYNIDSKVDHIVFSVADMRDMYGEKVNRFPYIVTTPTLDNIKGKIQKVSLYWVDQKDQAEEISDEHLVTLGKYQQFLGSFKPKQKETSDISSETLPVDKKTTTSSSSSIPNAESKQQNPEEEESLIQTLIRSNGHLAADVTFLRRCIHEMAVKQKELYLRSQIDPDDTGDTPSG